MEQPLLNLVKSIAAPAEKVWDALTNPEQMRKWYFPMMEDFEPRVGFETNFNVHHNGKDFPHHWKVTAVVAPKKITYEWKYGGFPGNSEVTFELKPEGESTRFELQFRILESFHPEENPELSAENFEEGWRNLTDSLQRFVEQAN